MKRRMPQAATKQQLESRLKLLLLLRRDKSKKISRVKKYQFSVKKRHHYVISFRRFCVAQDNRSRQQRQVVIPFPFFGFRELAISSRYRHRNLSITQQKIHVRQRVSALSNIVIVIGLFGILYFGVQSFGFFNPKPPIASALTAPTMKKSPTQEIKQGQQFLPYSIPTRIVINKISVDTSVVRVGQAKDGSIETPELFSHAVGWYEYSPTPGQLGPSIMVGNVDTYKGPSVFWYLGTLLVGDEITLYREDNQVVTYIVTSVEQFDQNNLPTDKLYGDIDHAGLRLITCGGTFDHATDRYSKNTVVFAKMKIDTPPPPQLNFFEKRSTGDSATAGELLLN